MCHRVALFDHRTLLVDSAGREWPGGRQGVEVPHAHHDLERLRALSAAQGGVVSMADLASCGFSHRAVARRVAEGVWQRLGGAILLAPAPFEAERHLSDTQWAAVLTITYGPKARISGDLALRRAGWQLAGTPRVIVAPHKPTGVLPHIRVIRRPDGPAVRSREGFRFMTPLDALVDSLIVLGERRSADVIDVALQQRLIDAESFARAVQPHLGSGRTGATCLRSMLERVTSGSRSEAEQRMGTLLDRSGTGPWARNFPVRDASNGVMAEIDFAHVGLRIAIEVDGRAHHTGRAAFERDRERQNILILQGWMVLRFTWEQITERPHEVIAAVLAAVAQRAA